MEKRTRLSNQSWSNMRRSWSCCCRDIALLASISFIFDECSQPVKICCMQFDIVMSRARYPKWFNRWRTVFVNGHTMRKINHLQKKCYSKQVLFRIMLRKLEIILLIPSALIIRLHKLITNNIIKNNIVTTHDKYKIKISNINLMDLWTERAKLKQ